MLAFNSELLMKLPRKRARKLIIFDLMMEKVPKEKPKTGHKIRT